MAYQLRVEKLENKIMYYQEIVECRHLIFWPGSYGRVHYHTAKFEPNRRVSIDNILFLVENILY
jgi:hypothetical protein